MSLKLKVEGAAVFGADRGGARADAWEDLVREEARGLQLITIEAAVFFREICVAVEGRV